MITSCVCMCVCGGHRKIKDHEKGTVDCRRFSVEFNQWLINHLLFPVAVNCWMTKKRTTTSLDPRQNGWYKSHQNLFCTDHFLQKGSDWRKHICRKPRGSSWVWPFQLYRAISGCQCPTPYRFSRPHRWKSKPYPWSQGQCLILWDQDRFARGEIGLP